MATTRTSTRAAGTAGTSAEPSAGTPAVASAAEAGGTVPQVPRLECDVVMKGGITSGVIYPGALHEIGSTYRIRGIGGASAGAIGAAVGAAAEYGRASGGFERLAQLPAELGDGRLAALFQPEHRTRKLLPLMLAATGNDRPGLPSTGLARARGIVRAAARSFPVASVLGVAPGVALAVVGAFAAGATRPVTILAGVVLAVVGWLLAVLGSVARSFAGPVPANLFGICRGLGRDAQHPGFTDWLGDRIDTIAGRDPAGPPLTFGDLWGAPHPAGDLAPGERSIDLRVVTTCLSEGRPYEMPWEARRFFFDPDEWRTLFPGRVVDALLAAPAPAPVEGSRAAEWRWEEAIAARQARPLHRLPAAEHLPVIVATRLSLSFPLLISAVPLLTIDRASATAVRFTDQTVEEPGPADSLPFRRLLFTDGGFCSNFPVYLFDAALPGRPTFAVNLGSFPAGAPAHADQRDNVEWARTNAAIPTPYSPIADHGLGAVAGFAGAAFNTARNWQDSSYLGHPGYRDRIVRVLQTKAEGGLNLHMDEPTIAGLADRGRVAAQVLVEQFTEPRYPASAPVATGWDNHRWVRYRALLSVVPPWIASYAHGRSVLDVDPAAPPSYSLGSEEQELVADVTAALDALAAVVAGADPKVLARLVSAPNPQGALRRIPQI